MKRRQAIDESGWSKPGAIDRQLHNVYYAAGDPGSYGGVDRLYRRAKELGVPTTRKQVSEFLTNQLAYSLHKPVRHKFVRNHTYVTDIDQQWQADLADMQALAEENDGYKYILTCIDILSRYAWAVPVKSKSSKDMHIAIKRLFKLAHPRLPQRLQTDKGKEFFNTLVSTCLSDRNINHFASNSDMKAAVVERFNRTLKNRIWVYFTSNNTRRYVDVLGDIVDAYNTTIHRSIHMRPADVDNVKAAQKAWYFLFYHATSRNPISNRKQTIINNQWVRISKWKSEFEKGYMPNWSREHFTVTRNIQHPQPVYNIRDTSGEPIEGTFYASELQPVSRNRLEVENVLQQRGRRGSTKHQALVKWRGWSDKFNRWIAYRDLHKYKSKPKDTVEHEYEDNS
jgi:transposase InsO family protein